MFTRSTGIKKNVLLAILLAACHASTIGATSCANSKTNDIWGFAEVKLMIKDGNLARGRVTKSILSSNASVKWSQLTTSPNCQPAGTTLTYLCILKGSILEAKTLPTTIRIELTASAPKFQTVSKTTAVRLSNDCAIAYDIRSFIELEFTSQGLPSSYLKYEKRQRKP